VTSKVLVVTSIARPTDSMVKLAEGARSHGYRFLCIGDVTSPGDFSLPGCEFFDLDAQSDTGFSYATAALLRHYARKNIGYLVAMRDGARILLETDDDNAPLDSFWMDGGMPTDVAEPKEALGKGWINVYRYFGADAWPRGLPLENVMDDNGAFKICKSQGPKVLVRQGLVKGEPDVDAIFRLTRLAFTEFENTAPLWLGSGVWSPFNSQNTWWNAEAFPLLYLPATCSFRATDIVRGYVALRCLWELGSGILFVGQTAVQDRNPHDLMRDFRDEIVIYTHAATIAETFEDLPMKAGSDGIADNMRACYQALVELDVVTAKELELLDYWLADIQSLSN